MATPEEIAAQRRAALEAAARQPVYGPRNPQQPIASPGYSDDLNTRRVQAYRDAQQQRAAVAGEPLVSPGYTPGLAGMQAAQDARMQREAVAALPPARVAGRDPDVPYAPAPAPIRPPVPAGRNPDVPYVPGTITQATLAPLPATPVNTGFGRNADVPMPDFTPDQASTAIRQDTANLRAYNEATNAQFAASDAQQAAYQQQLTPQPAATPASPYLPAERGNYTMQNTDRAALAERAAPTAGLTMGFSPGEATARMQQYATQDAQAREAFQTKRQRLDAAVEGIGLRNAMEKGNAFERKAAGARMEELQKQGLLATQQAGETGRANIAAGAELERARIAGQYGLLGAQTQGEYGLEGQDIVGKYGLLAADIKAQADQSVAAASVDPKKQQEAMLLAARNQQLLDAIARNDQEAIRFYTSGKYAPVAQGDKSPYSGVTYDPATLATLQESERLSAQQRLQAQKTQ